MLAIIDWPLWKVMLFVWLSLAIIKSVITTGTLWHFLFVDQRHWRNRLLGTTLASILMCGLVTLFVPVLLLSQRRHFWLFPDRNLQRLLQR
ncbi:hypothetical protein [Candidatus Magnetaquicoccus inordinatus]|uniref:hypothetical protein n=1 Tax=Candidatus Magnetaquicoccus inordinatus TaxID=2496818 RepID=UPI00102BF68B|nr:hypothetical protein [Candidatus Magnetaquicoccus inordinatus]